MTREGIREGVDKIIDDCYSRELSACPLHIIFHRQKFLNELFPYLDSKGVVRKVDEGTTYGTNEEYAFKDKNILVAVESLMGGVNGIDKNTH